MSELLSTTGENVFRAVRVDPTTSLPYTSANLAGWRTTPFLRWLNPSGDGTHTTAAIIGNYAATPTDFYYQVPVGTVYAVAQILITISSSGSVNHGDYGNIAGGLTNGVKLIQVKNGVETQLIGGLTVKKNYEYLAATDAALFTNFSGGAETIQFAFDSYSDLGAFIELNGNTSDKIIFRVNDNFSTLINHKCVIRGVIK